GDIVAPFAAFMGISALLTRKRFKLKEMLKDKKPGPKKPAPKYNDVNYIWSALALGALVAVLMASLKAVYDVGMLYSPPKTPVEVHVWFKCVWDILQVIYAAMVWAVNVVLSGVTDFQLRPDNFPAVPAIWLAAVGASLAVRWFVLEYV